MILENSLPADYEESCNGTKESNEGDSSEAGGMDLRYCKIVDVENSVEQKTSLAGHDMRMKVEHNTI